MNNTLKHDAIEFAAEARRKHGCSLDDVISAVTWAVRRMVLAEGSVPHGDDDDEQSQPKTLSLVVEGSLPSK